MTDNEKIAEFMGYKFEQDGKRRITWPKGKGFFKTGVYLEVFKYDTSWDWLMPVIEKIRDNFDDIKMDKDIHDKYMDEISYMLYWTNIKSCSELIVKYIDWYNSQKP